VDNSKTVGKKMGTMGQTAPSDQEKELSLCFPRKMRRGNQICEKKFVGGERVAITNQHSGRAAVRTDNNKGRDNKNQRNSRRKAYGILSAKGSSRGRARGYLNKDKKNIGTAGRGIVSGSVKRGGYPLTLEVNRLYN